jgi:hypothetical protein
MKRSILILSTVVVLLCGAVAARSATCQLGVKGGLSIMELTNDGDSSGDRTGFAGGAYLLADFSEQFGLRVEGLYFQKGAHEEEDGDEATIKLDYIEFPILAVAHVPLGAQARLDFFGGPTFGFNVKSELELTLGGFTASGDLDGVEAFEFGVTFGAGVNFDAGPVVLGVDGRYGLGVTDVASEGDGGKNRGFAVMASLGFPIGAK